ncbi:unnamed protein product [Arabidopsis halleri]
MSPFIQCSKITNLGLSRLDFVFRHFLGEKIKEISGTDVIDFCS